MEVVSMTRSSSQSNRRKKKEGPDLAKRLVVRELRTTNKVKEKMLPILERLKNQIWCFRHFPMIKSWKQFQAQVMSMRVLARRKLNKKPSWTQIYAKKKLQNSWLRMILKWTKDLCLKELKREPSKTLISDNGKKPLDLLRRNLLIKMVESILQKRLKTANFRTRVTRFDFTGHQCSQTI